MGVAARILAWLNTPANALGSLLLAPIGWLPGWLSATLVVAATGVLMLLAFKYTSNQEAIKRVRGRIKANLLALSLFKDSVPVSLRAQARILGGAMHLLGLAVVPMLVMLLPMCLLLGQLALWYQARPLAVGEEAVVTLRLAGDDTGAWPAVRIESTAAVDLTVGPVKVLTQRAICWNVAAREAGYHRLVFDVDGRKVEKQLAVGNRFMRVSPQRPALEVSDVLLYPAEAPLESSSPVRVIEVEYPSRSGWTTGSTSWLVYWFVASMVAAVCFRRALNVNL